MGLFGNRDIDDFDDYRKEQDEMRKERESVRGSRSSEKSKVKNFYKAPNMFMEEQMDGSLLYTRGSDTVMKTIMAIILLIPFTLIVIKMITDDNGLGIDKLMPAIVFFGIFFFITIAYAIKDPRCKSFRITSDSIEIAVNSSKKYVFPLDSYEGMSCKRTYGKNHHYSGTTYHVLIRDGLGIKKFKFCTTVPYSASNFDYQARKRQQELHGSTPEFSGELPPRKFTWNEKLVRSNRTQNKLMIVIPMIVMVFCVVGIGFISGGDKAVLPIFGMILFVVIMTMIISFSGDGLVNTVYPENMEFEGEGLRIDDLYLRAGEIKGVYIIPVGQDNPREAHCTTFYIVTDEGQYRYRASSTITSPRIVIVGNTQFSEWSYSDFYNHFKMWCVRNNVQFIDYLI